MAAKDQNQEYISSLQDFSKSVEYLVKAIQNQVASNENTFADIISSSKEQAESMSEAAKQLVVMSEDLRLSRKNSDQILNIVKGIKKERQSGIWDKLDPKDKVKGVAQGISTVALMAGSILAIGTAFALLDDVDFGTVMALAIALPLMAIAFGEVADHIKDPKHALSVGASMVVMSASIAASGYILSSMPVLSFMQMVSAVAVSAAMGVAMYGLANAADDIGSKKLANLYAIIPAIPLVAAGIVGAGFVLQNMPNIGTEQFLSTIGVGVALATTMVPLALAASLMKSNNAGSLLTLTALLPVISASIVASALVLQNMPQFDFSDTMKASFAITLASTTMAGGIFLMNKMGLGIKEVAIGTAAMTIMSAGLMASSWILSVGNYSNYPSVDWAEGVGLSMLGYLPSVLVTGAIAATGIGALVISAGIASMLGIAAGLVATSKIISKGKYEQGPSVEWSQGVGLALSAFGSVMAQMSPSLVGLIMGDTLTDRIDSIKLLGASLVEVADIIRVGNFTGGPKKEWAQGVGLSIKYFAEALSDLDTGWFSDNTKENMKAIPEMARMLNKVGFIVSSGKYEGGPSVEWAKAVGSVVSVFATSIATLADEMDPSDMLEWIPAMKQLAPLIRDMAGQFNGVQFKDYPSENWSNGVLSFMDGFSNIGSIGSNVSTQAKQIRVLGSSFMYLSKSINSLSYSLKKINKVPDLSGIYGGLVTLSVVDNDNLNKVLYSVDKKKDQFTKILNMVKANSDTSINDASFATTKSSVDVGIKDKNKNPAFTNSTNVQSIQTVNKKKIETKKDSKVENYLYRLITLQKETIQALHEISDNTGTRDFDSCLKSKS